tara:strand:+ start:11355 stop:11948 length:594 start_codon:yes stop_codon:yes gene_type:complete
MNKINNEIKYRQNANDVIYTPKPVAEVMIKMCNIQSDDKVLDCSKGGGVFYDNLPECDKSYCEITEDIDYFEATGKYNLIIGNPPYSLWSKWLDKTTELTDKFCYIFGVMNLTRARLKRIYDKGYVIKKFHILQVDYWFSMSFAVLFEKGEPNESVIDFTGKIFFCDICGKRCMRGRTQTIKGVKKKWSMNECSELK